jgi:spermidine/putrescine transport system substrate-binding protein
MPLPARTRLTRRHFLAAGSAAAGLVLLPRGSRAEEEKKLNVYNWDTYIGETTLDTFKDKTGIDVQYDLFANNEELFGKLKEGNPGYDIIVPSDYMVEIMVKLDMLMALDKAKLPNIANIDPKFADLPYDPGMAHSIPYMWGTIGVGYRKSKVDGKPDSWADLIDSDKYAGRIALLDDQRAVLGVALKYLGYSLNSTNPDEIGKARDLVIKHKKNIKAFAPDEGQNMLAAGDADLVQEWNGDILSVMQEDDDLDYLVPKEGGEIFVDNMAIPTGAPHPDNAHAFLNHILDAQVCKEIVETINFATANLAARKLLPEELQTNPAMYPPDEVVAKSEHLRDLGDATRLYDEAWTAIKAA